MTMHEIKEWLQYWANAKMVAIDQINAFDQVHLARQYCSCMREGLFSKDLVTDLQIWRALLAIRNTPGASGTAREAPSIEAQPAPHSSHEIEELRAALRDAEQFRSALATLSGKHLVLEAALRKIISTYAYEPYADFEDAIKQARAALGEK